MTSELHILCGIPGVGKSTWARHLIEYLEEDRFSTAIISRDSIRFKMLDESGSDDYFAHETEVFKEFVREINEVIALGIDYVFVDATHINPASRMKILRELVVDDETTIIFDVFDYDIQTAITRNNNREGREKVPNSAIRKMWKAFKAPTKAEIMKIKEELGWNNSFSIMNR